MAPPTSTTTTTQASVAVPTGSSTTPYLGQAFANKTNNKFKQHDYLIFAVMAVTAVAFVTMVLATYAMYNDQAHFNNELYRDGASAQSAKMDSLQKSINDLNAKVASPSQKSEPAPSQ